MFPLLFDLEIDGFFKSISYTENVKIKLDNLPQKRGLKFLKKEIKKHKKQIKKLELRYYKTIRKWGYSHSGKGTKTLCDELNFLNQKYSNLLKGK